MNIQNGAVVTPNDVFSKLSIGRNFAVIFSMVFVEFLIMGISFGILPSFIYQTLHLNNVWVGVVIGLQYVTTLATRPFAGKAADHRGGRWSVLTGISATILSGIFLLLAVNVVVLPVFSLAVVLAARILLGIGESFLVVGIFAWGFTLAGPSRIGKVMVWNGMGMYAGMACGAPLATFLQGNYGLSLLFTITIALPLLICAIMFLLPAVQLPRAVVKLPFHKAVAQVWPAGSALALASIGFGGIVSFISLYFVQYGWQHASLALTAFGGCYVIVRLFFSGAPDKFGGARIALISLVIEMAGQLLIWAGLGGVWTILGAALTGAGMSLIFPSLGQLAVKKVEPSNRGTAVAAYNAFFDLGMGLTAPVAGLIAGRAHYQNVYLLGAVAALASLILVLSQRQKDVRPAK